jgi:hypothetical protein
VGGGHAVEIQPQTVEVERREHQPGQERIEVQNGLSQNETVAEVAVTSHGGYQRCAMQQVVVGLSILGSNRCAQRKAHL